ncbi:MAG: hypothetical protein JSV33_03070 [bacterium]|nr:MAG: hypothetical protein JSV33_03070 [bacterium]
MVSIIIGILILTASVYGARGSSNRDHGKLGPVLYGLVEEYDRKNLDSAYALAAMRGLAGKRQGAERAIPVILEPVLRGEAWEIDRSRIEALDARVDAVSRSFMRVLAPWIDPELNALVHPAGLESEGQIVGSALAGRQEPIFMLKGNRGSVGTSTVTLRGNGSGHFWLRRCRLKDERLPRTAPTIRDAP